MNKDLLEKYRYINVDHDDWWDCTYDTFKQDMEAVGIQVNKMYFSGFWSQGDGACFEGFVADWRLFLPAVGYDNGALIDFARHYWTFSVTHSGHYYHENCTHFDSDLPNTDDTDEETYLTMFSPYQHGDFRAKAWVAVLKTFDYSKFEDEFTEVFKSHMRDLYRRLETDHDYLTSDEAVWDVIVANELDTTSEEV
jgi:hypothetical protein